MAKQNIINLILLAVVAILLIFVVKEPGIDTPYIPPAITELKSNEITHASIQVINQEAIELELHDGKWYMTKPYQYPANDIKIEPLLIVPTAQSKAQYNMADIDPIKFKLDKPSLILSYNNSLTLSFGGQESTRYGRYVQFENTMHIIEDRYYPQLMTSVTSWLDYKILPSVTNEKEIKKIVLPNISIEKVNGKWHIYPMPEQMSKDQIILLLDNWTLTRAVEVSTYKRRGNPPRATVFIQGNEQAIIFDIIETQDFVYLGRNDIGVKFKLSKDRLYDMLNLPPFIYIDETQYIPPPVLDNEAQQK